MENSLVNIIFLPAGVQGQLPRGISVVEAARRLGLAIETPCGEQRLCGKCIVRIETGDCPSTGSHSQRGHAGPWQPELEARFISPEDQTRGYRLGCVARLEGDLRIFVPEASRSAKQVVFKAARTIQIDGNPAVRQYYVRMTAPTSTDSCSDFENLCRTLVREHGLPETLKIDIHLLRQLPAIVRQADWGVTVSIRQEKDIIRVRPGQVDDAYGMAIDVGTTTVAGYLCNLNTLEVISTTSMMNPQFRYGEDIMSRITYSMNTPGGLEQMRANIVEGVNQLIADAVADTRLDLEREDIEDVTLVFNTAMHHIFLGLDPQYLGKAPFPPVIRSNMDIRARDLGLAVNPSAYVHILPNLAGFVGADNMGVLICEEPYRNDEMQLIIDIGTNGELVLGNRHRLMACSCATGPALEGAQISCGMRAAPGAMERVRIDPNTLDVNYKVIGRNAWRAFSEPQDMQVRGVCGSGILDVLAEFFKAGIIKPSGAFDRIRLVGHARFRRNTANGQNEFVLAFEKETVIDRDIVITQKDIRQIQLAKAAVYAGCRILMNHMGLDQVDRVKIAGAFGMHIDPANALIIGLFPDCPLEHIESIGNAAGDGCRAALLNINKRREAAWCSRNVEYLELTLDARFEQIFVEALPLPLFNRASTLESK